MIAIIRPPASRALATFYRTLAPTLLANRLAAGEREVRIVESAFEDPLAEAPDVALFSLYIDDVLAGLDEMHQLHERRPDVKIVVGGPHVTLLGERAPAISPLIDHIGIGDCLDVAIPAIEALDRGEPVAERLLRTAEPGGFDAPDFSPWKGDRHFPVFPIEMSRGCRHRCPFCTDPVLRRGAVSRGVEPTLQTLLTLVEEHGEVFVRFVDSSFSSMRPDVDVLLQRIIDLDLPVHWSAYAYASDMDAEFVDLMRRSGCRALFFGVESLSADVLTGKRFSRDAECIDGALRLLRDAAIFAHCNFIVGLPGETRETVRWTLERISEIRPDSVGGGPFYLTPGSTFDRRPERFGIEVLDPDWVVRQHENFHAGGEEYFRTAQLSQGEMWALAAKFRDEVSTMDGVCWNLSDYALVCWESVGGDQRELRRIWRSDGTDLGKRQELVLDVLKEKTGVVLDYGEAQGFVDIARDVATGVA